MAIESRCMDFYPRTYARREYEKKIQLVDLHLQGKRKIVVTRGEGVCEYDWIEKVIALIKRILGFYTGREKEVINREILSLLYLGEMEGYFAENHCLQLLQKISFTEKKASTLAQRILQYHNAKTTWEVQDRFYQEIQSLFLSYQRDHPSAFATHRLQNWYCKRRKKTLPIPNEVGISFLKVIDQWNKKPFLLEENINRIIGYYQQAITLNPRLPFLQKVIVHAEAIGRKLPKHSSVQETYSLHLAKLYLSCGIAQETRDERDSSAQSIQKSLSFVKQCGPESIPSFCQYLLAKQPSGKVLSSVHTFLEEVKRALQNDAEKQQQLTKQQAMIFLYQADEKMLRGDFAGAQTLLEQGLHKLPDNTEEKEALQQKMAFYTSEATSILQPLFQHNALSDVTKKNLHSAAEGEMLPFLEQLDTVLQPLSPDEQLLRVLPPLFFDIAQKMVARFGPKALSLVTKKKDIPIVTLYYKLALLWESSERSRYIETIRKHVSDLDTWAEERKRQNKERNNKNTLPDSVACHPLLSERLSNLVKDIRND